MSYDVILFPMYTSSEELPEPQEFDPLPLIKKALGARIAATSLRATAREVGLSATGLHGLVYQDVIPYVKTRQKIAHWFAKYSASTPEEDGRLVGVELLTRRIHDPALRQRACAVLLAFVSEISPELVTRVEEVVIPHALAGDVHAASEETTI
jgi:hypothetical protein